MRGEGRASKPGMTRKRVEKAASAWLDVVTDFSTLLLSLAAYP